MRMGIITSYRMCEYLHGVGSTTLRWHRNHPPIPINASGPPSWKKRLEGPGRAIPQEAGKEQQSRVRVTAAKL